MLYSTVCPHSDCWSSWPTTAVLSPCSQEGPPILFPTQPLAAEPEHRPPKQFPHPVTHVAPGLPPHRRSWSLTVQSNWRTEEDGPARLLSQHHAISTGMLYPVAKGAKLGFSRTKWVHQSQGIRSLFSLQGADMGYGIMPGWAGACGRRAVEQWRKS